jgi:hypothetical protein
MRNRLQSPEHNGAPWMIYDCRCCSGRPKGSVYKSHLSSLDQLKEYEGKVPMDQEEIDCISIVRKDPHKFYINEKTKEIHYDSYLIDQKTQDAIYSLYFNYGWYILD